MEKGCNVILVQERSTAIGISASGSDISVRFQEGRDEEKKGYILQRLSQAT